MKKEINCPHCGKPTVYEESNPNRPFCCERCKILDLGGWADEKYTIPDNEPASSENLIPDSTENDPHKADKSLLH